MKISKAEYLKKAKSLTEDEQHRLLSRMTGKLPKRLSKEKLTVEEAIAIQLEIEDEQLQEWRKNWEKIKKQDVTKSAKQVSSTNPITTDSKKPTAVKTAKAVSTKPAAKTSKTALAKVAVSSAAAPSKNPAAKPKAATTSSTTGAAKVVNKPVSKPAVKPVAKKSSGAK